MKKITLISDQIGSEAINKIIINYDLIIFPKNFKKDISFSNKILYSDIPKSNLENVDFKSNKKRYQYETIFLSSGSTGNPKKIPISLKHIDLCSKAVFDKLKNLSINNENQTKS